MTTKHPYKLIDSTTNQVLCVYKALTIALRDCAAKNAPLMRNQWIVERRYYVLRPNGSKVTA